MSQFLNGGAFENKVTFEPESQLPNRAPASSAQAIAVRATPAHRKCAAGRAAGAAGQE